MGHNTRLNLILINNLGFSTQEKRGVISGKENAMCKMSKGYRSRRGETWKGGGDFVYCDS